MPDKNKKPQLTKAEEFYLDNNPDKSPEELATDIGKPLSQVISHISNRKEHRTDTGGRVNALLIRDKGCVVMTEGASMASDKAGYVTQANIQAAAARGDYEEAHRLQQQLQSQRADAEAAIVARTSDHIHYINRTGDVNVRK